MSTQPVWHYDVHRQHAYEDLRFYLLKFTPSYDRGTVFPAFSRFCQQNKIFSYGLYEVFGPVDLIFRCWIPHDEWVDIMNAFETWTKAISPQCRVGETDQFDIRRCRHHFLWHDEASGDHVSPNVQRLPELIPPDGERVLNGEALGSISHPLVDNGFLRFRDEPAAAIRFFIVVSAPQSGILDAVREDLLRRIGKAVRSVHGIRHLEIYEGAGTSSVLIDGVIDFLDYPYLSELQTSLRETGIVAHQCRTSTFLCVDNIAGVHEHDHLRIRKQLAEAPHPHATPTLNELFAAEESPTFELKGSARLDLYKYYTSGQITHEKALEEKLLQTIVAFRNSDGGDLIIGGMELDRFPEPIRPKIQDTFPKVGAYYLCGIDPDWAKKGVDKFQRYLRDLVADRIGQTTATEILIECVPLQGITVCRIHVPRPRTGDFEYLDGSHFIVRRGAASVELTGSAQEQFQRSRRSFVS